MDSKRFWIRIIAILFLFLCGCSKLADSVEPNSIPSQADETTILTSSHNESISEISEEESDVNSTVDSWDWGYIPEIDPNLMLDIKSANGWVYFLYPDEMFHASDLHKLFRWREDETDLTPISSLWCDSYTVLDNDVYFAEYPSSGAEHGVIYIIKPDKEPQMLADELCFYQIVDNYIYYAHSFDTIGVGIEGHALHRIDLDGNNHMIVAYEVGIPGISSWHIGNIKDGYINYENIRVKLGEPADGTEEVQLIAPLEKYNDDGWLYYATNRLFKARPDGSNQSILDGDENSWISINRVDSEWIYYTDNNQWGAGYYKIQKDGQGKTEIDRSEYYD